MKSFIFIFSLVILYSCSSKQIINPGDYDFALGAEHINKAEKFSNEEINFWQGRLNRDTGSFVNMLELGYNYLSLFKLKGNVDHLKKGDSLIKKASGKLNNRDPNILEALSQAAITQHRFKKAAYYNEEAFKNEGSPYVHALLSFDAGMETGAFQSAKRQLGKLKNQESFHVLIRKAKYQDHLGDLAGGIKTMESAFKKIKNTNNGKLYCWALSNLGDMYSHAGRIKEAYTAYIQVLKRDPSYIYVLKGLAWIAYAHDNNTAEAKRLLGFILSQTSMPDLYLTLSEMEDYEGNEPGKKEYIQKFLSLVKDSSYGDMYNKYLLDIYTDEIKNLNDAQSIALREVINRPTPETFSWLSWVYFRKGDIAKAHAIYNNNVKGKDFEPTSLYRGGYILAAAGKKEEAKKLFEQSLESSFELGPVKTKMIKEGLQKLN
jgi:tetratricopeptide (TPR) repeat protein